MCAPIFCSKMRRRGSTTRDRKVLRTMRNLRINLFTYGDALDVNTWSNLPYYFHRALLAHDVHVSPINLMPSESMFLKMTRRLWSLRARAASGLGLELPSDLFRTKVNYRLTNRNVRTAVREHADADLNVFMTFSFSSYRYAATPVIHYCDRTYEQHLEDSGRVPTRADRTFIQVERENIEKAALVLTTSEVCLDFIKARYQTRRVVHLRAGLNVEMSDIDPHSLIAQKEGTKNILFIGRGAYKRGVDILIKAFTIFNQRQDGNFVLHIVGVRPQELAPDLQAAREDIRFYGYLDRTVAEQRDLYNALIQSARLFVFPMRPGPVAGVIREAQLNCTPVIISGVPGTSERVAHDHNGILVESLEPEDFARHMEMLVTDVPRWRRLAHNAHLSIRDGTWSTTARNFLQIAEASGLTTALVRLTQA